MEDVTLRPPKQHRSRRTLQRIARAALELIAQSGVEGTTIEAIARRAGSSVGSFYARFESKADLLVYGMGELAVVEIAGQGHTEALVVAGLGAALWAGATRMPWASVGVMVAALAKLYPFALLPMVWRRDGVWGFVASAALAVLLSVPVWSPDAGSHVRESLGLPIVGHLHGNELPSIAWLI